MPRTQPAPKTLLLAISQARALHQRAMQDIMEAATVDHPELEHAQLDIDRGLLVFPDEAPPPPVPPEGARDESPSA